MCVLLLLVFGVVVCACFTYVFFFYSLFMSLTNLMFRLFSHFNKSSSLCAVCVMHTFRCLLSQVLLLFVIFPHFMYCGLPFVQGFTSTVWQGSQMWPILSSLTQITTLFTTSRWLVFLHTSYIFTVFSVADCECAISWCWEIGRLYTSVSNIM